MIQSNLWHWISLVVWHYGIMIHLWHYDPPMVMALEHLWHYDPPMALVVWHSYSNSDPLESLVVKLGVPLICAWVPILPKRLVTASAETQRFAGDRSREVMGLGG